MRILYCTFTLGSGYGVGYATYKEIESLKAKGADIYVLYLNADGTRYLDQLEVEGQYVKYSRVAVWEFISMFMAFRKAVKKLPRKPFDIIYANGIEFSLLPLKNLGTPLVTFARSSIRQIQKIYINGKYKLPLQRRLVYSILIKLEKHMFACSSLIFAKSSLMRDELIELYNLPSAKVHTVSGGIDPLIADGENTSPQKTKHALAYFGRLVPQKGVLEFLQAMSISRLRSTPIHIFGDTDAPGKKDPVREQYLERIRKCIHKHELNVQFHGKLPQEDVFSTMKTCTAIVIPSLYEPFGMVALQAAYCGIPIIVSKYVGAKEVLEPSPSIIIADPYNQTSLAEAIDQALESFPGQIPTLGKESFQQLEWSQVTQVLTDYFNSIILAPSKTESSRFVS